MDAGLLSNQSKRKVSSIEEAIEVKYLINVKKFRLLKIFMFYFKERSN